jgi:hypothetical protein
VTPATVRRIEPGRLHGWGIDPLALELGVPESPPIGAEPLAEQAKAPRKSSASRPAITASCP